MTTLASLVVPLTVAEVTTMLYDALAAQGVVTTSWKPGAVVRTLVAGLAIVIASICALIALLAKGGFLDLAEGDWLTLKAKYDYLVDRDLGSFASGIVTLTNSGGGIYSGDADDLIFGNSTTGKTYRVTASWSLGSGTSIDVPASAVEIGSDSNANAGDIDTLVTPLTGVSCSNAAALVGSDSETDAALRDRCRDALGALSPDGPRDAYFYVARTTLLNGASIGVTRVATVPDGLGNVDVYLATASGGVTGTVGDTSTALGAIADAIDSSVVPIGLTATVQSATPLAVPVSYSVWLKDSSGLTSADIEARAAAAIAAVLGDTPIGGEVISPAAGKVYVDAIEASIIAALPVNSVIQINITLPASDVAVAVGQAPVAGSISASSVTFVPRGGA